MERPPLESALPLTFHPGAIVVTITIDVRDGAGNKVNEHAQPPTSLCYPHGEKLEQVLAVYLAQVRAQYEP